MSKKYFGTDGIRGRVGDAPITPDFMMRLGYAAGRVLTSIESNLAKGAHPAVLIGKDTRISGYMLEAALEAGLSAAGVDILLIQHLNQLADIGQPLLVGLSRKAILGAIAGADEQQKLHAGI
ncbi:MAG: hypothetical protein RLZZ379_917, partial [Pseudomonadota bacterium]